MDKVMTQIQQNAEQAFRTRQYAKSVALYREYFAENSADYFSLLYVAKSCMMLGLRDQGLGYYDQAIKMAPGHGTAFTRKACYLLEQNVGAVHPRSASSERKQISMRSLGNKCRFGNQILQYAFLHCYANKFDLDIGCPIWPGSYMFDFDNPLPATAGSTLKENRVNMLDALTGSENPLEGRDITGFFQYHTGKWNSWRNIFQDLFTPSEKIYALLSRCSTEYLKSENTVVALHIRRGDYVELEEFDVAPSNWYLEWLEQHWATLDKPLLYVATDDPNIIPHFRAYSPISCAQIGADCEGLEFVVDWVMLRDADILAISNSTFSMTAAMANVCSNRFLRPDFSTKTMREFTPWDSEVLTKDC